jgi:hypothetical protein
MTAPDMTVFDESSSRFRVVNDWQNLSAKNGDLIVAFWRREGAIKDAKKALTRLQEVVAHACDESGQIVAVCTAYPSTLPRFGQPMYHYRCFVGAAWRTTRLVSIMLRAAQRGLGSYARANDFPCIGILIELENPRFIDVHDAKVSKFRTPIWQRSGFIYVGKSARGLDLRVYYFTGAQLKQDLRNTPIKLEALATAMNP